MRSHLGGFLLQLLQRHVNSSAAHRGTAASKSSDTVLHDGSIAVNYGAVVYVQAEFISRNLREGSLLSLAMRRSSGQDRNFAGRLDADGCALPAARRQGRRRTHGADLNIGGNANAHQASFTASLLLLLAQLGIIGHLDGLIQRGLVVAAIVEEPGRSLERLVAAERGGEVFTAN